MTLRQIVHSVAEEVKAHRPDLSVRVDDVDGNDPLGPVATNIHVYRNKEPLAHVFSFEKGALEVLAPFPDGLQCKVFEPLTADALGNRLCTTLRELELVE